MTKLVKKLLRGIWWLLCASRRREQATWTMTQEEKAQIREHFRRTYKRRYKAIRGRMQEITLIDDK